MGSAHVTKPIESSQVRPRYHVIAAAHSQPSKLHANPEGENYLAYFPEHTEHFDDYVEAVGWAEYARWNRRLMMDAIVDALRNSGAVPPFEAEPQVVNCHH